MTNEMMARVQAYREGVRADARQAAAQGVDLDSEIALTDEELAGRLELSDIFARDGIQVNEVAAARLRARLAAMRGQ